MYKLNFLLRVYAWPFYRRLGMLMTAGALVTLAAALTPWAAHVALVYALALGALLAMATTLGVTVLNAALAAGMHRAIERFEAAYDAHRRANKIPDIFYEEMDLAESAEH